MDSRWRDAFQGLADKLIAEGSEQLVTKHSAYFVCGSLILSILDTIEHIEQPRGKGMEHLPPQRSMTPEESANLAAYRKTKFKRVAGGVIEGEPRRLNTHDVFLSVYEDIKQRNELGWAQHSKPLLVDNHSLLGWLEEAYAETLDKAVYLKGAILKLKGDSNV